MPERPYPQYLIFDREEIMKYESNHELYQDFKPLFKVHRQPLKKLIFVLLF